MEDTYLLTMRCRCQASAAKVGFAKIDDDDLIDVGEDEERRRGCERTGR
jgi:hypothetical protein